MTDSRMVKNIERWRRAVATHDVENPKHTSYGVGLSGYDIERLGLEAGEELWSGIRVEQINVVSGNFRVLCDGEHDECDLREKEAGEAEPVKAVSKELIPA